MADVNTLIDEFITKLSLDDDVSAKAAAIAAVLDRLTGSAEKAGAAVLGAGSAAENAGAKVAAQAAAWDRLAARQDAVTAATVKLAAAQEELKRTQQLAAAALSQGGDQDQVNRVLEKQISNIERLKATLVAVRDAQEGATQANTAWTSSIEKGDELLSGLAISAKATADSFIRGSAEAAVYGQSLDALRARFDSVFRTTKDYEAELALLNQAFALGAIKGPMAQARALDELNAKYSQTTGTTEALAAAQVAAAAAAQKQADAWQTLGASITSLNSKLEAQRASYDSVYRVSKQYEAQFNAMTDDLNRNRISQEQFNIFLDKANASMANATRTTKAYSDGHGQAAFATRQLGVQTVQFFSSLESGIPFMTALVEQGHQLVDVALSTGTGFEVVGNAIKKAFAAATSTTGLVVTGITAVAVAIAAMSYSAESSQRTLINLQATLRGTREDYLSLGQEVNQASRNVAATSPLSVSDARAAGATIAGSPQFSGSQKQLEDLIRLSGDLARSWGVTVPDAAKVLAAAMSEPGKVADDLAKKHVPEMNAELARTIERMANAGDVAGAYNVILEKLKERHDNASASMTPLQRSLDETKRLFTSTSTAGSSWGDVINQSVADVITHFNTLIAKFQEVRNAAKQAQTDGNTGGATPGTTSISASAEPFGSTVGQLPSVQNAVADLTPKLQQPDTRLPGLTDAMKNLANDATAAVNQFNISMEKAVNLVKASPFGKLQDASDAVTALDKALAQLGPKTDDNAKRFDELTLSLRIANKAQDDATIAAQNYFDTATDKAVKATEAQIQGNTEIAASYAQGGSALVEATAHAKAYEAAIAQGSDPASQKFADTVDRLTTSNIALAHSIADIKAQEDSRNIANQIDLIKAETEAVLNNTAANRSAVQAVKDRAAAQKLADSGATPDQIATQLAGQEAADYYAGQKTLAQRAVTDAGHSKSDDIKVLKQDIVDFNDKLKDLHQRTTENAADWDRWSAGAKGAQDQIDKLSKGTTTHVAALTKQTDTVLAQTDANHQLAAAYAQGGDAVVDITAKLDAQKKLITDGILPTNKAYQADLEKLTAQFKDFGRSQAEVKAVQESNDINEQIKLVQLETATLLDNNDARTLTIQHKKDEYQINKDNASLAPAARQALLAEKDTLAQVTQNLQNQQQTLSYLQQQFSSAFDTIGNSITQAFVQGSGSAVKWGNVMQGVITQVIQMFAHLAIINPITNSIFGQNQPTLGSALSLLGGGGGASTGGIGGASVLGQIVNIGGQLQVVGSGGGGIGGTASTGGIAGISGLIGTQAVGGGYPLGGAFGGGMVGGLAGLYASGAGQGGTVTSSSSASSLLSNAGTLFSVAKALFPDTFSLGGSSSSIFGNLGNSLGLTGENGLLGTATSLLNTPIFGTQALASATNAALSSTTPGVATLAQVGAPGFTVGGVLGAAGAGYGAGSLIGSYEQKALNKTGPAPQVGAALGTAIGIGAVALAPETFGTSLLLGALIGGSVGGAAGGLIGPKPASAFSSTIVNVDPSTGLLSVGGTTSQRVNASGERTDTINAAATVNDILSARGLRVTSLEGANTGAQYLQVGQNTPGGFQDPSKYSSLAAAFPSLRFSSPDPLTNQFISGRLFQSPEELQGVTTSLADFENALKGTGAEADTTGIAFRALAGAANTDVQPALQKAATFITATLPTLTAGAPGSLATAQSQVSAQFGDALTEAAQVGYGTDQLLAAQQKLYDKNNLAATQATDVLSATQMSNFYSAKATVSGSPADALQSQLYAFDNTGQGSASARQAFSDQLTAIWGDAFTTTQGYNDRMAQYDKATAEQRLAIQEQFNKQVEQNQIASNEQLLTLQARVGTSAAALSGDPNQIHAAAVSALASQQAIENVQFNQSEQQTFGANFATEDPNYTAKITDLQTSQVNEMALLNKNIADQNRQLAVASQRQDQGFATRFTNAAAALNPSLAPSAAMSAFDVQAKQEAEDLTQNLVQTYGDAYATTQAYADKLAALQKAQGEERLGLEKTLNDQLRQQQAASAQQDASFATRYQNAAAQVSGSPQAQAAAQLAAFDAQATQEMQNLVLSLVQTYGDVYTATQAYGDKINALEQAQGEERLALVKQIAAQETAIMDQFYTNFRSFLDRKITADAAVQGSPADINYAQQVALKANQATELSSAAATLKSEGYGQGSDTYTYQIGLLQKAQDAEYAALIRQQHFATVQRNTASDQQNLGFASRYTTAAAAVSGYPGTMNAAALSAFDTQAKTELQNLQLSLQQTYGTSYAETQAYADKITALQKAQGEERLALQVQQAHATTQLQISSQQQNLSFATRYQTAAAQISGGVAAQNAAALAALDAQATAELQNLRLSLVQTYGNAYATTKDYSDKITALTKAQGEERLALQQQQNDALKSQATQSITALNQYAIGLQTSDKSPYSPQAQLTLARGQFTTQAALAAGGNFAAVQTLQQYSDAYLAAAHTVFGSGVDYVKAFGQVITALATVGAETPDTLTASILQTETRTQTQILVEQLQELQDEVHQLRLQVQQGTAAPARVAVN
jgi:hypothetical protein